jgi:predicted kinase
MKSKVIMMCGISGSGKSTYSKKLEKEGFIRLSIDETMWIKHGKYGIDYPEEKFDEYSEKIELLLKKELLNLIQDGKNIVLDYSFWNKDYRDTYKKLITDNGVDYQIVYLKAEYETLYKRLLDRNKLCNPNAISVDKNKLDMYWKGFEEPVEEGEIVILQT